MNIVRNALTLLVLVVSRPLSGAQQQENSGAFGFRAIKPALDNYPMFLESLVGRLSAADHLLCANALQLINALLRDAVVHGGENEWPRFIKRLQDMGVIASVGALMRGDAPIDADSPLAAAILEFQGLTKVLLKRWKEVRVNLELSEHKRALKTVHLLSKPEPYNATEVNGETVRKTGRKHHPQKWRRLGFETESPAWDFEETGYLGLMDLVEFAKRHEDLYYKTIKEHSYQPADQRCPLARASLNVTSMLYEHFEIGATAPDFDSLGRRTSLQEQVISARDEGTLDVLYRPLLLQWARLHAAVLNAFFKMWKAAGAETADFHKIVELVRIIVERVLGESTRKTEITKVEEDLRTVGLAQARKWQMEGLDDVYQEAWGPYLGQVREQLHHDSLEYMKEQRIRCMLQGSWFAASSRDLGGSRYVKLSPNRRYLHYRDYPTKSDTDPAEADLTERLDINAITSVDSNVSATSDDPTAAGASVISSPANTVEQINSKGPRASQLGTTTTITIVGTGKGNKNNKSLAPPPSSSTKESVLLELYPTNPSTASIWLDGLLMLLDQQPITKDTTSIVDTLVDWGVRLRLLNLRWEDVDWEALERRAGGGFDGEMGGLLREVPGREGTEGEYWFALPEA